MLESESEAENERPEVRMSEEGLKQRVDDVLELIMTGASFPQIRQFAMNMDWQVSDRQLYRYQDMAYKRLSKSVQRNFEELRARHLQQRRTLYSRCVMKNDCRTALQILRDEAELNGLYPSKNPRGLMPRRSPLSLRERTIGLLVAEGRGDMKQVKLLQHASPQRQVQQSDTEIPLQTLKVLTLQYVGDQLDAAGVCMDARLGARAVSSENALEWGLVAATAAFVYRLRFDAWQLFMQELGLEPGLLVKLHYQGAALAIYDTKLCPVAPSLEQLREVLDKAGRVDVRLETVERLLRCWRKTLADVCPAWAS